MFLLAHLMSSRHFAAAFRSEVDLDNLKVAFIPAQAGSKEVFIDDLPGYPDGFTRGENNTFWISLINLRQPFLEKLLQKRFASLTVPSKVLTHAFECGAKTTCSDCLYPFLVSLLTTLFGPRGKKLVSIKA